MVYGAPLQKEVGPSRHRGTGPQNCSTLKMGEILNQKRSHAIEKVPRIFCSFLTPITKIISSIFP